MTAYPGNDNNHQFRHISRQAVPKLDATHGSGGLTAAFANVLIFSLTTEIPRSSDALSSNTLFRINSGPKSSLHSARIVDVLPVPGGP